MTSILTAAILCACVAACQAVEHGLASWYGEEHRGRLMANGKRFDPDALTAASWTIPLGSEAEVVSGTRRVRVTITDRGPNKRLKGRIIDLSAAAFRRLGRPETGLLKVDVRQVR